jgi:serine-type D-Ala-D-Ala carboxypeptidase (penicillin-binding protein 5/6)
VALALAAPPAGAATKPPPPDVPSRAWILLDAGDGTRLAAHHANSSAAMASTTKLMTAHLVLGRLPLDKLIIAAPYDPIPGESLLGLEPGEHMSVHDLLYGLLLPSGNDAAATLADGVTGPIPAFVGQMNRAARRLGLDETSYANPIGLDEAGNYSSPRDLASLAMTLRRNKLFRRIVNTPRITLETGNRPRTIENHNDLVLRYPWINGVKTGYTLDAGYVLVATGTRKGVTLLSVEMGAPSIAARDRASLELLDYGFSLYRRSVAIGQGERLAAVEVPNAESTVGLLAQGRVRTTVRRGQRVHVAVDAPHTIDAPVRRGQRIGTATATLAGEVVGRVPLVAARRLRPVPADSVLATADDAIPGPRAVVWVILGAVAAIVILMAIAVVRRRSG